MASLQNTSNYNKTRLISWVTLGYRKQTRILERLIISLIQLLTEHTGKGSFMYTPYFCVCVPIKKDY